ncbi:transposase IS431 [Staphylococcus aureus]|nr:transposase IS431 [Staphylococcus aureus]
MNYFRYKQFNKDVITVAVGYYLRYALSYRDISEILRERGVNVHHSTVYRWVQEYAFTPRSHILPLKNVAVKKVIFFLILRSYNKIRR